MEILNTERNFEENQEIIYPKKIFETLKVPERSKRLMKLQSNIGKLDDSVALLDVFITKQRSNLKANKKNHKLSPLIYSPNKINIAATKRATTLNNDYSPKKKKKVHKCKSKENYQLKTPDNSKKIETLKPDSINKIKLKKQVYTVKKAKNNEIKNTNDVFVTKVELPDILNSNNYENENKKKDFRNNIYKLINQNQGIDQSNNNIINSSPNKLKKISR